MGFRRRGWNQQLSICVPHIRLTHARHWPPEPTLASLRVTKRGRLGRGRQREGKTSHVCHFKVRTRTPGHSAIPPEIALADASCVIMRLLPCCALTTCLLAYTSPPDSPRLLFRRISAPQAIESPTLGTLSNIVQQLVVQQVASEADIQKTVTEALSKASAKYETDAAMLTATAAPRPLQEGICLPVKPTTITEAKRAFRRAFSGSTLRAPTVKFVNVILDTTCIWKYEYSRVWAVGFTALCDSFLGAALQGRRTLML